MPVGSIVTAIISAAVAVGTTITSQVLSAQDTEEAKVEAESMWNKQQKYKAERTARQDRLNNMQMQMNQKAMGFEMSESRKNRRMQKEALQYQKVENQYQKGIDLLNQNKGLRADYINTFRKAAQ